MILVFAFVFLFLSLLFFTRFWIVAIIGLVVATIFGYKKYKKAIFIVLAPIVMFGVLTTINFNLVKDTINDNALVISSKENYVLVYAKGERFYISEKNNEYEQGDILYIKGEVQNLEIYQIESEFDFEDYLNNKGVKREIKPSSIITKLKVPIRKKWIIKTFLNNFDENNKAYIEGLLFANIDYSNTATNKLKLLNLINVFTISGIILNFVFMIIEDVLFKFIKNEFIRRLVAIIIISPYIFFTFTKISVLRVYLLKIVKLVSSKIECLIKPRHLLEISVTGITLLTLNPMFARQSGFYIGMFISIMFYLLKQAYKVNGRIKQRFVGLLLLYVLLLPVIIRSRNEIEILGIGYHYIFLGVNLINFIFSLMSFYLPILTPFVNLVAKGTVFVIENISLIKLSVPINLVNEVTLFLYYGSILSFMYFKEIGFKKYERLSISALLINLLLAIAPIDNMVISSVNFINIGQGDACLIKDGLRNYMIDVGGSTFDDLATNALIPYLNKNKVYKLDAVFISHYDYDHYGSLSSLSKQIKIDNVYDFTSVYPITIGNITFSNLNNRSYESVNDNSVVLYFTFLNIKWLFTGDIGTEVENNIIVDYKDLDVDVLKVAHHGSIGSYSEEFIKEISPQEAVISSGRNYYGHPSKEVLELLKKYNVKIRRTDKEGTISYKRIAFSI